MKLLKTLGMSAFAVACLATSASASSISLFSTNPSSLNGVPDVSGWTLVSAPSGSGPLTDVTGTSLYPGAWSAGTNWISPGAGLDQSPGFTGTSDQLFVYQTSFSLAGLDAATAIITGNFASDNQGIVLINGHQIADNSSSGTFNSLTSFSVLDSYLNAGNNFLEFDITNIVCPSCNPAGNPTGLLVNITQATAAASAPAPVPEPLTISLFGAGLAGAAALRRRRANKA
jgi:hypothetical protein